MLQIRDYLILAQSDLAVAVNGMNGLLGREYTDIQLIIARRGISDAMLKLQTALSLTNDKQVSLNNTNYSINGGNSYSTDTGTDALEIFSDSTANSFSQ